MTNIKELSIKQNMLWNMVGSAIGLVCQWAISIFVVRLAPDLATAGLYSLAMSVYGIFSPVAQFGMYTYIITDMDNSGSIGEYVSFASLTSFFAFALTVGYACITCRPNSWFVIAAYALYKGIAVVIDILHAADQKAHRMDYIGISLGLQGVICLLSFVGVFSCTQNLTVAVLSMAFCTLMIGVIYDLPKTKQISTIHLGISRRKAMLILSGCILIVISSVASGAFASLPRQAISQELGDATLGIYASIAAPVAIIQVGSTYIYNPLIGYFAESFHHKDADRFKQLARMTLFGIGAIGAISYLGSLILAEPVLNLLYGEEVASHAEIMTPLIVSSVLLGVSGFLSNLLVAVRALRIMLIGSILSLALVMLCSNPLVLALGMNGATLALSIGCLGSILTSLFGIAMQSKSQFKGHSA